MRELRRRMCCYISMNSQHRGDVPISVLDLSPIRAGDAAAQALHNTRDLARHAEQWGYHRYWVAEHHNMTGIAGAATAVVIGHVAGATTRIRVGSGGVMLPNHAPLVIAEQFGTLESLYPGRIDLGLGRAPGTDPRTAHALRRDRSGGDAAFPQDVLELQSYFRPAAPGQAVRAVPGAGLAVPIWLLGSSTFSAQLAARLGLPFAFAAHFSPDHLHGALAVYRDYFEPSESLQRPYAMVGVNVFAADTDAEAARLFTSLQQQFLGLLRGAPGPLQPPVDVGDLGGRLSPAEAGALDRQLRGAIIGSPETVRRGLTALRAETGADEVMATAQIYDHTARLHSFEIVSQVHGTRGASPKRPQEDLLAAR